MAEEMLNAPDQNLPGQFTDWADLKAAYRFCDNKHVDFDAISTPHWKQTRQTKTGRYLLISDTTDIDFTGHTSVEGLGMLGNGTGLGFQLHPCLVYSLDEKQVVGIAGALTYYRSFSPKNETSTQRLARSRESELWGKIVDQLGPAPTGSQWIHVFDRAGDHFEAISHIKLSGNDWVIRASRLNRNVMNPPKGNKPIRWIILTSLEVKSFQEAWEVLEFDEHR